MKSIASLILVLALRIAADADTAPPPKAEAPIVMTINGEPVSTAEYLLVMERQKASIYFLFKEQHNLDDYPGFWSAATGADSPLARLRQATLDELIRIKVNQGLGREKGLIKDASYTAFQADWNRENASRNKALATGQVIYGPRQFREATYYYKRLDDLVYELKCAIGKEQDRKAQDDAIAQYINENRESLGGAPLTEILRARILTVLQEREYEARMIKLCAAAKWQIAEPLLRPLVPRGEAEGG